ncbi:TrmH family RNA methyltransferase [Guggenheimella bovis]
MSYKSYQKKDDRSYTQGPFPTIELLKHKKDTVEAVLVHPDLSDELYHLIESISPVPLTEDKKSVEKLRDTEKTLVIGVFKKYEEKIFTGDHLVLVNPSNFGNLGTIIRSALGFRFKDIALIEPCCDPFNPQVLRASMGSLFSVRIECFQSFTDYRERFKDHTLYSFYTSKAIDVEEVQIDRTNPFGLVLGNESTGLEDAIRKQTIPVTLEMSEDIDSLNLTVAASIGLYTFMKKRTS